uniref:Transmembrane protein n=1 Tax=Heterorhabditis bacteriophora TaxID=37862 RepID=A0A1I7WUW4_HETBA
MVLLIYKIIYAFRESTNKVLVLILDLYFICCIHLYHIYAEDNFLILGNFSKFNSHNYLFFYYLIKVSRKQENSRNLRSQQPLQLTRLYFLLLGLLIFYFDLVIKFNEQQFSGLSFSGGQNPMVLPQPPRLIFFHSF